MCGYDLMRLFTGQLGVPRPDHRTTLRTTPMPPQRRGCCCRPLEALRLACAAGCCAPAHASLIDWLSPACSLAGGRAAEEALLLSLARSAPEALAEPEHGVQGRAEAAGPARQAASIPNGSKPCGPWPSASAAPRVWLLRLRAVCPAILPASCWPPRPARSRWCWRRQWPRLRLAHAEALPAYRVEELRRLCCRPRRPT